MANHLRDKRLETTDQAAWSAIFEDTGTRRGHMSGLVRVHHLQESMLRCRWCDHLLHFCRLRLVIILALDPVQEAGSEREILASLHVVTRITVAVVLLLWQNLCDCLVGLLLESVSLLL